MITCCLTGPGRTPAVTLCGDEYIVRSGTLRHIPRKKVITEKKGLTNQRRRQISWNPEQWELTIAACSLATKVALQTCYQAETYQSYTFTFSYEYDYGAMYAADQLVTFDDFEAEIVADHPDRWDVAVKLTEWM